MLQSIHHCVERAMTHIYPHTKKLLAEASSVTNPPPPPLPPGGAELISGTLNPALVNLRSNLFQARRSLQALVEAIWTSSR